MLNSQFSSICKNYIVSHLSHLGSLDNEQLRTVFCIVPNPIPSDPDYKLFYYNVACVCVFVLFV